MIAILPPLSEAGAEVVGALLIIGFLISGWMQLKRYGDDDR